MPQVSEGAILRKLTGRLIPFLFLLYIVAYLDRVNVGFAKLQMNQALGFSEQVYGFGAGIFFLGYFLFEIPSNLILERVGARRWIARIMFTWGLLAMAMAFTRSAFSFYSLRFLLGLAEAGFFPGIILYLTYWFTAAERARIIALFMTATAISNVIGSPISGALLTLHGLGRLDGWQWLFLLEGLPAVLLGFVVLLYLPDGPQQARWLRPEEREWVTERLEIERRYKESLGHFTLRKALGNPMVWRLSLLYFLLVVGMYGITLWMPTIIKNFSGLQNWQVGLLAAIPYIGAAVGMVLNGQHSDETGERRKHIAIPAFIGAAGLAASAVPNLSPGLTLVALVVAAPGMWATLGPFWSLPTAFLSGTAAAGGIALINSVGNLGGFVGPYLVGWIKDTTHSFAGGLLFLAGSLLLGSLLALTARHEGAR
ncbi:MAG TPA: MFS transporter [Chthonomonadaceae bacterium]|nr:MFS transporter [Chthonomonadaceae bacterium]